jgi:phosphate transport system permease protein
VRRRPNTGRKAQDLVVKAISAAAALLGIFFLGWILLEVGKRGLGAFDVEFFTSLPAPPGAEGGGLANAILGTLIITAIATVLGVARGTKRAAAVRFIVNAMMGLPSIIIGLFVYTLLVLPFGHFSGFAGAVALAIIMLPVVARTADDMLSLVPNSLREAALALGAPRWRVTFSIVFRAAKAGLVTGVLLAIARVSGETAPLLFTALNSVYWPSSLMEPMGNLTVTIFNYAMSPYADWQRAAWGASLLIMAAVLGTTVLARFVFKEKKR